ncbi:MAG: hypothetical protein ACREMA_09485, partial [Longimicrobiales bacterium]
ARMRSTQHAPLCRSGVAGHSCATPNLENRMTLRRCFTLLLCCLQVSCIGSPTGVEPLPRTGDVLRVLFIGNSLTYVNTLPAIVEALADSAKVKPLSWKMVAYPDYNLEDHWARPEARNAIREGGWDVVVLQQGPSSTIANRAQLIASTRLINEEIRRVGGRAGLYAVWPQSVNLFSLEASAESYRLAADSVDGRLFPVSLAWKAAWAREPNAPLYSDGLHASVAGSYLAALVIFQQLYQRSSVVGLPARLTLRLSGSPRVDLDARLAGVLQQAAQDVSALGR